METGTEGSTDGEPPPTPGFIEPASGRLDVPIVRSTDVVLGVTGVLPAATRLEIDGQDRGALELGHPLGVLEAQMLTLRLRGAMIPARHTMQLVNDDGGDSLVSATIEVFLLPDATPTLRAEVGEQSLAGRIVATHGAGPAAVLAVYDDTAPAAPVLHVVPLGEDGWRFDDARRIAIADYHRAPGELGLAIAAQRVLDGDRLRVAWRVGRPGVAIDLIDVPWSSADEDTVATRVFDLDPSVLGSYEHAELGRPALVGDTIVAEAFVATDVENPRPGDRTLVAARLREPPDGATGIARVTVDATMDIDAIGPALDVANEEVGGPPLLSARLDARQPVVFEAAAAHGRLALRPSKDDGRARALANITGGITTILGAFGSRTALAMSNEAMPRPRFLWIDDWGDTGVFEHALDPELLPAEAVPTGELAVGIVAGAPVWLVPYGADEPVRALIGGGERMRVQAIDELRCTHVAIAFDPRVAGESDASIACANADVVVDGRLRSEIGG